MSYYFAASCSCIFLCHIRFCCSTVSPLSLAFLPLQTISKHPSNVSAIMIFAILIRMILRALSMTSGLYFRKIWGEVAKEYCPTYATYWGTSSTRLYFFVQTKNLFSKLSTRWVSVILCGVSKRIGDIVKFLTQTEFLIRLGVILNSDFKEFIVTLNDHTTQEHSKNNDSTGNEVYSWKNCCALCL